MGNRTFNTGSLSSVITVDPITLNVGIGGAPTAYKANVTGAVAATNFVLSGATGNTGIYYGHTDRVVLANYTAGGIDFEVNGGAISMTLFPTGNLAIGATPTDAGYKLDVAGTGRFSNSLYILKSSNSGSGSAFPTIQVKNTLATQGDGSSTFNFSGIYVGSGNDAVLMTMSTTYAAGTWAPAGILNVITNHDLQIKTNNTTRLTIASGGAATFSSTISATGLTTGTTSGSSISITTSSNAGTSGSPLQTSLNFLGYNGNINGQIRVNDISSTAQVGSMFFYTWNSAQVLALTLSHTAAATFAGGITANNGNNGYAFQTTNASNADFVIQTNSSGVTVIGTTGNRLALQTIAGGNVLIGTTTDDGNRLQVIGKVTSNGYMRAAGTNTLNLASTGVNYLILNFAFSGIIIVRDNTTGGSAIYLLDTNLGVNTISTNLTFSIAYLYSGGGWYAQRIGGVNTNISFNIVGN